MEFSRQEPLNSFVQHDSWRDLSVFDPHVFYGTYNLSAEPGDIISFDNLFFGIILLKDWFSKEDGQESCIFYLGTLIHCVKFVKNLEELSSGTWWKLKTSFQISVSNWRMKIEIWHPSMVNQ